MADTPFVGWDMKATGAPVPRKMPDRLADIINVKDYGAFGDDGLHDDGAAIQLAFDTAFGSSSAPHGNNTRLNRPVYFPPGRYHYNSRTLNLTAVVGGLIYGDGPQSAVLRHIASSPGININGCVGTAFRGIGLAGNGISTSNGTNSIYLNWDGNTSTVGLDDLTFFNMTWGGSQYGIRIAPTNHGGKNINFIGGGAAQCGEGISVEGDSCVVNLIGTTMSENWIGAHVLKGSLTNNGLSNSGSSIVQQVDYKMDSTGTLIAWGGRSEGSFLADVTNGKFIGIGILHAPGAVNGRSVSVSSGASVNLIGCTLGSAPGMGWIEGAGDVFLKNVSFTDTAHGPIYLQSFTGRVCQYVGAGIFTVAQLPTTAADGLILPISNSNTGTWGADIGPATGSVKVLGRFNATRAKWTVVGI